MVLDRRIAVLAALVGVFALPVASIVISEGLRRDKYGRPAPTYEIRSKPIPTTGRLDFNAEALPKEAKGKFPSFDGDSFIIHFPPHLAEALTAEQVLSETVVPLLKAMGYTERIQEIMPAREAPRGHPLPRANLSALAAETCREVDGEKYRRFHAVCAAMREKKTNEIAERVFQLAYGMTFVQFVADVERQWIQYVFTQRVEGVPVEHGTIVAARWEGETIASVHGTVFNRFSITNKVVLSPKRALAVGQRNLLKFIGAGKDAAGKYPEEHRIDLVLLPSGGTRIAGGSEVIALRNAYRTLLFARRSLAGTGRLNTLSWMAWIDAETGALLELTPQFAEASATGLTWRRDPNTPTQVRFFEVDAPSGGQFTLQLTGVFNRVDRLGNGAFTDDEVTISSSTGGSSATFANFNQVPINDAANAVCGTGGNNTFRQVNAYADLYSQRQAIMSAGSFPTFPESAVTVYVDMPDPSGFGNFAVYDNFGSGQSLLNFVLGTAYANAACPDVAGANLPGTEDPTSMMHEFAHLSTPRLQERRPSDWCGMAPCPMPTGRTLFHDFADSWAQAYASTPCQAGWSRKNVGGANASLNCAANDQDGGLPRLSSVGEPFNPADVQDHFPERRAFWTGDYADGQIVSTALWLTRQGMRSKCLPSGTPQFFVRLNRALYNFGFLTNTCGGTCDRDIYRFSQDLLRQMTQQWATAGQPGGPPGFAHNGAHSTNKLLSGFARVGLFLIPSECIDGDATTGNPSFCPMASGGENGGEAIVDIDDNDPTDDPVIDGITHPEVDYAKRGAPPSTFRVWTGPRYKFNATGQARSYTPSGATPSPCNTQYQVELASDDTFTTNLVTSTVGGTWQTVSNTTVPECYARWTPNAADWTTLSGTAGDVKVYYRVRTRDAGGSNEKISTQPGSGSYSVPPAYVIVNNAGQP